MWQNCAEVFLENWNVKLLLAQPGALLKQPLKGQKQHFNTKKAVLAQLQCLCGEGEMDGEPPELGIPVPFPKNTGRALYQFTETVQTLLCSDFEKLFPVGWSLKFKSFWLYFWSYWSVFWVLLVEAAAVIYLFIWIAFALQWLGVMTDYISVPLSYKFVGQKDKDLGSFLKKKL